MACVAGMSVRENLALGAGRRYASGLSTDWAAVEQDMRAAFQRLDFPVPAFRDRVGTLSGGHLQRTVVARELAHDPRLIVALYPTRGLDVRSAVAVRALMRKAREAGTGILLVSEDLEELFSLCDRLLVLFAGRVAGEFLPSQYAPDAVGRLMTGSEAGHGGR